MNETRFWALRLAGLALSLAPLACTSEEGPTYDIPAREQAGWLSLEIDSDGSPLILSQIGMNYSTKDKRRSWDNLNTIINTQTVLYSRVGGTWKSHGFRNLNQQWGLNPKWTRNDQGALQPLVWHRDRITLYSGSAKGWKPDVHRILPQPGAYWSSEQEPHLWPMGDTGWHRLDYDYPSSDLVVRDENDVSARLDTATNFRPVGFLYGPEWLGVVGFTQYWTPKAYVFHLIYYQWNRNLAKPSPRKTVLDSVSYISTLGINRIQGEWRLTASVEEGLAEWVLKGDRFESKPTRVPTWMSPSDTSGGANPAGRFNGPLYIDTLGCVHRITALIPAPDSMPTRGPSKRPSLLRENSCRMELDTIDYSIRANGKDEVVIADNIRIGPDGTLFYAFTVQEQKQYQDFGNVDWSSLPVSPSRIEFGFKRPGGTWVYETVARF